MLNYIYTIPLYQLIGGNHTRLYISMPEMRSQGMYVWNGHLPINTFATGTFEVSVSRTEDTGAVLLI